MKSITLASFVLLGACAGAQPGMTSDPAPSSAATPAAASAASAEPEITPQIATATFDSAWSAVNRTFWDTTFYGVDWRGLRETLRPSATAATTNAELRRVITGMLGQLGQSHFGLIPGDASEALTTRRESDASAQLGDAGMEVRYVDGDFLVTRVAPGGAADAAGVRPGWLVHEAGGMTAERVAQAVERASGSVDPRKAAFYAWGAMSSALEGSAGDTVALRMTDGAGRAVQRSLVLRPVVGQVARFGNLPPMAVQVEQDTITQGAARIGVIRFNVWMPAAIAALDRAVNDMREMDGIVIDLRGNVGGVGAMAPGWGGHFVARMDTMGTMITRRDSMHFVMFPRRVNAAGQRVEPYAGPVAILTDEISGSTSEIFAGGMQTLGRARVFGATSAGQALPALMPRLPNGDVLMHAIADMVGPGGERWEARGVVPDVPAPATREALLAGRDPALDAAAAWIAGQARK